MGEPQDKPALKAAEAAAREAAGSGRPGLPPVHLWNPPHCGEIDIVIRKDGSWWHQGAPIGREALVRLFSTILRKDEDGIYLVTPVEKLRIEVEDAPFLAVVVEQVGDTLRFLTNLGDEVEAGPAHPIRVAQGKGGEPRPYIRVRGGLEALITRPVFFELAELAQERPGPAGPELGVVSQGQWFPLGPAEAAA